MSSPSRQSIIGQLKLSWERIPVDETIAEILSSALYEVAQCAISAKTPGNVSLSIVSRKSFSRATHRTNGNFNPNAFATQFLSETGFSALRAADAIPEGFKFLTGTNGRPGSRVALMLRTPIENEQRAAHDLLLRKGLCDRPFLSGAHLSIGTLVETPTPENQKEIGDYLMSLIPDTIRFNPVTQQTYAEDGLKADRIPLSPEPLVFIDTLGDTLPS